MTISSPVTSTYHVEGMTCDHCVRAVREEIGALSGVRDVSVDLPSGTVEVSSERALGDDEVAAAVNEAGYRLGA